MKRTLNSELGVATSRNGGLRKWREGARIFLGSEFWTEENKGNEEGGDYGLKGGHRLGVEGSQRLVTSSATSNEGGAGEGIRREGLMECRCNLLISHFCPVQVVDFPLCPARLEGGRLSNLENAEAMNHRDTEAQRWGHSRFQDLKFQRPEKGKRDFCKSLIFDKVQLQPVDFRKISAFLSPRGGRRKEVQEQSSKLNTEVNRGKSCYSGKGPKRPKGWKGLRGIRWDEAGEGICKCLEMGSNGVNTQNILLTLRRERRITLKSKQLNRFGGALSVSVVTIFRPEKQAGPEAGVPKLCALVEWWRAAHDCG